MIPGVGICPTFTISRIVLSDAVALVRGDRFYTIDYSPKAHTNWGFNEQNYDLNFNSGCVFYKLLLRALPNHFESNSIYAHEPMTVPNENEKIMKNLGRYHDYDYSQPKPISKPVVLRSTSAAKHLNDLSLFGVSWNDGLAYVFGSAGRRSPLGGNTAAHQDSRQNLHSALHINDWQSRTKQLYQRITAQLLRQHTVNIVSRHQVDIADICNLTAVHFVATLFGLPLRTAENANGVFSEQELWMALCTIHSAIFLDTEPAKSMSLRKVARKIARMLGRLIEMNVKPMTNNSFASKLFDSKNGHQNSLHDFRSDILRKLVETSNASEVAFAQILPAVTTFVPLQSRAMVQVVDFYLGGEGSKHLPEIQHLAKIDTPENDKKLLAYINEALRLSNCLKLCRRAETDQVFTEGGQEIHIRAGDKVMVVLDVVDESKEIRLDRDPQSYISDG